MCTIQLSHLHTHTHTHTHSRLSCNAIIHIASCIWICKHSTKHEFWWRHFLSCHHMIAWSHDQLSTPTIINYTNTSYHSTTINGVSIFMNLPQHTHFPKKSFFFLQGLILDYQKVGTTQNNIQYSIILPLHCGFWVVTWPTTSMYIDIQSDWLRQWIGLLFLWGLLRSEVWLAFLKWLAHLSCNRAARRFAIWCGCQSHCG